MAGFPCAPWHSHVCALIDLVNFPVTGDIRSRVGTPCYLAPEVLQSDSYAEPADVWGAGCCLFEAITLCFLWDRKGMLGVQVLSDAINASKLPPHYSSTLRSLVESMLAGMCNPNCMRRRP